MPDVLDLDFSPYPLRVVVHRDVIKVLKIFRKINPKDTEACGLLLGRAYNRAIEITAFTPPQASDQRKRYGYLRSSKCYLEEAIDLWQESEGLIGYLGEWHTHPESRPHPSHKDVAESRRIATLNSVPLTNIIVGYSHACVFVIDEKKFTRPQTFQF